VWVLRNDALRPVPVVTGIDDGTLVEVSGEGLEPGDTVVLNRVGSEPERKNTQGPSQTRGLGQPGLRL
jgi:multidrug efflux pump subunit AcrA (membrane-fusion protein)